MSILPTSQHGISACRRSITHHHSKGTNRTVRFYLLVVLFACAVLPGGVGAAPSAQTPAPGIVVVNTVADDGDAAIGDGVCSTAGGTCSLRAAIEETNARRGPDEIRFNIGGGGVRTITLRADLPAIADFGGATLVDGYSQPGAAPNTDPAISNARIMIEIVGNGMGDFNGNGAVRGFRIFSANNTVRGLALYNLFRPIMITQGTATNNSILGNFIGTNAAGTFATQPRIALSSGVIVQNAASRNRIGSVLPQDRNVIVGNPWRGVNIMSEGSQGNEVKGNIIGLSPRGDIIGVTSRGEQMGNGLHNVDLQFGAIDTIVGGLEPGARNIIGMAGEVGVEISHDRTTQRNIIIGNCIGTGVDCQTPRPNGTYGVRPKDGVTDTVISNNVIMHNRAGGVNVAWRSDYNPTRGTIITQNTISNNAAFGVYIARGHNVKIDRNTIHNNGFYGVLIDDAVRDAESMVTITQNSIFAHENLGIERNVPQGPNPSGLPILTSATPGRVAGRTCANCLVEVFRAAPDAGELYGEGQTFLASQRADANGLFSVDVAVEPGAYVTATSTTPAGDTSEFSYNRLVTRPENTIFVPRAGR